MTVRYSAPTKARLAAWRPVNSWRDAGVLGLVWQNGAELAGTELPAGYLAVRSNELTKGEGSVDSLSNLGFAGRLDREQRAQVDISANPL